MKRATEDNPGNSSHLHPKDVNNLNVERSRERAGEENDKKEFIYPCLSVHLTT